MLRSFCSYIIISALILFSNSISAQVGALKKDFGNGGYVDINLNDTIYTGLFTSPRVNDDINGNIYFTGIFNDNQLLIHKLRSDGKPDLLFGNKSYLTILSPWRQPAFGQKLLMQADSDENIYLLATTNNVAAVYKYNRFGKPDLSFGTNGAFILPADAGYAADFKIDNNNNFYYTGGNASDPYVVKFNKNGILDNTFGANGIATLKFGSPYSASIANVLIDSQGYLYLSAEFYNKNGGGALIKLNQDGSFANSFGTQGVLQLPTPYLPKQISFDNQERICILDQNINSNHNLVFRYLTSGLPDVSFGQNGVFDITLPDYLSTNLVNMHIDIHDNIFISGMGYVTLSSPECLILKINTTTMNFDSSFHSDGIMNFTYKGELMRLENAITNADGTIFASGNMEFNQGSALETVIIDASGTIKGSFTNQKQNPSSYDYIKDLALNERGDLYLSSMFRYDSNIYPSLTSLTPEGNFNQAFGTNGIKVYPQNTTTTQDYIAIEKNGSIYVTGTVTNADPTLVKSFITKTDAYGNLVSSFGTNGVFTYTSTNNLFRNSFELLFDQDSSLLVFENNNNTTSIRITKIARSGNIDLAYGNQGSIVITNTASIYGQKAVIDNNGAIYISGLAGTNDIFTVKITNQTIDASFGINGFYFKTFPLSPYCSAASFDSNNNLILSCSYMSPLPLTYSAFIYKLTPIGQLIPEFGSNGLVTLPYTNFTVQDLILDTNDNIFLFGNSYHEKYVVVKVNYLGTVDVSYGNNGLSSIAPGGYIGVTYDKQKGVAYLYGEDGNSRTDIRIICLQIEKTNFNTISGTVFKDADASCDKLATEAGIYNMSIVAQPGNNYSITDASGYYTLKVDTGTYQYTVKQLLNPIQKQLYVNTCTEEYQVPLTGSEKYISNIDFADKANPQVCPLLYVDVQNTVRRRCYGGITKIKYANYGTASESNVTITVTYPQHNIPKTSMPVWQSKSNNVLTYSIGTLNPGQEGFITIADSISCLSESILGLTQCVKAEILPVKSCLVSPAWDHSEIIITQTCASDSLSFYIKNVGTGDMDAERNFYVFVNDTIVYSSPFLLESQRATLIKYPANGKTIRVSAEQHSAFPFPSNPSIATQGCSSTTITNPVHTPLTNMPLDDRSFHVAYSCLPIIGSFDPNHKSVTPSGYGDQHYIKPTDKLNFTIQFQNVGTDTAFKVVIKDTLDTDLDVGTLLIESASHPFTYTLSGRGVAVLQFSFDPILLTDSTTNLKNSQGFISYSIYPKEDIADGAVLTNKAYIYFDYNSPIITNETMLTIRNEYVQDLSKGSAVSVRTGIVTSNTSRSNTNILVYPNPTKDYIRIRAAHVNLKNIQIMSISGNTLISEKISGTDAAIKTSILSPGIYFYLIMDDDGNTSQGKLIIE